jgi:hypothetical protein
MSDWTPNETEMLLRLWPKASATQIAGRLNRSRSAVCRKAQRLRDDGVLPHGGIKYFEVVPVKMRPHRRRQIMPKQPPSPTDDAVAMRPCAILELDDSRCHWPLGEMHRVETQI